MTGAAAIVQALQAVLTQPGQPARAAARCQRLIERLETPVRVAVFGLPHAGKSAVINALAERAVLQPGSQVAPVLIRHAGDATVKLTDGSGTATKASADIPFAPPPDVAMVELGLPVASLTVMDLFNVVADPEPEDMSAALAWAASRCDIAIWCSRHWTVEEQAIWQNGPDSLGNHCLMVATTTDDTGTAAQISDTRPEQDWFELSLDTSCAEVAPASAQALRQRIARMIEEARAADLDLATFLLEQYAPRSKTVPDTSDALRIAAIPKIALDVTPEVDSSAEVSPEALTVLSRLILLLRQTARKARVSLIEDRDEALLEPLQEALEQAIELAEANDAFLESYPAVQATLREAVDLILLLGLESGGNQTTEAAILLAQVRLDMEFALVA